MIKLPKRIKVGPHDIEIKYPHKFIERHDVNGVYRHDMELILLGNNNDGTEYGATSMLCILTHEILHAIAKTTGCEQLNDDEGTINAVAQGLVQVLQDNPEYTRLFVEADRSLKTALGKVAK